MTLLLAGVLSFSSALPLQAQTPRGTVEGRVLNASTGNYLNNARVAVEGTQLETLTNENGEYRLVNVPAGEVRLRVSYTGFDAKAVPLQVAAEGVARQDVDLTLAGQPTLAENGALKLESFVVEATTLSAQASAINEQRTAPNIKNVVVLDEIGDLGDGNIGEYLKYTPGISIVSVPQTAGSVSIRGLPAGSVVVMMDGAEVSSPGGDRAFDLAASSSGSVDRIEVTKVPTPDRPANAVGGTINIVGKSGFSMPRRSLKISTYGAYNSANRLSPPGLNEKVGTDSRTLTRVLQPGMDVSYSHPVSKTFAFTVNGSASTRIYDMDYDSPTWDLVRGVQTGVSIQPVLQVTDRYLASTTFDWKIGRYNSLRLNLEHVQIDTATRQNNFQAGFGAGVTGDALHTQGAAAGNDFVRQNITWGDRTRGTSAAVLRFAHEGKVYKFDAGLNFSRSWDERKDLENGFFRTTGTTQRSQLVLRADGLDGIYTRRAAQLSGFDRSGNVIDPYDGGEMSVGAPTSQPNLIETTMRQFSMNVSRELPFPVRTSIKTGFSVNQQEKDNTTQVKTWTFTPPGGANGRLVKNLDITNDLLSSQSFFSDTFKSTWVSPAKLYDLYQEHPEYFVLNEAAAYISEATNSKFLEETISAAYVRGDVKFLNNRVWLVGGVRFEKTEDHGFGALDNIRATYRQDANGNILRDAAGKAIPVTTDPLETAKLRYTLRGAESRKGYDGYYPSFNTTFYLTEDLVLRAAWAKTIGRPNLAEIIPGITISDPEALSAVRTINVTNTGLQPWTADNYDLSLEAYNIKGAVASVGVFRKDIKNFFGVTRTPATPELLAGYGLSDDYLDYEIVTKANFGEAQLEGYEASWRQTLFFLPSWARGFQVFGNATITRVTGANAADFSPFAHKNLNWGASFLRKTFSLRYNVAYTYDVRGARVGQSATVPADTFTYVAPQITSDVSFEYRFTKRLTLYGSARNLGGDAKRTIRKGPGVPVHAQPMVFQNFGTLVTLGVRAQF